MPTRALRVIGTIGAFLSLCILGASMLLRLATIFGTDGQTISTLPVAVENFVRLIHRLAASGVGILAIWATVLGWTRRPLASHLVRPLACFVAATVLLAVIGPLTPGYRSTVITVLNVAGGIFLLMAFWWLRESAAKDAAKPEPVEPLLAGAILVFLLHVATGAAASANEMHDMRGMTFLHLGTALLSAIFIGATLWSRRHAASQARHVGLATLFLLAQLVLGFMLLWLGERPTWLALIHGMGSPLLAMSLVSLAACHFRNGEQGI